MKIHKHIVAGLIATSIFSIIAIAFSLHYGDYIYGFTAGMIVVAIQESIRRPEK